MGTYRIHPSTSKSVRGDRTLATGGNFLAPRLQHYALLARVTAGRVVFRGQRWFEANQWFRALGASGSEPGGCILYDVLGSAPGQLELAFNDDSRYDNSGGATIRIQQWW